MKRYVLTNRLLGSVIIIDPNGYVESSTLNLLGRILNLYVCLSTQEVLGVLAS
jgi:hypothetical protein